MKTIGLLKGIATTPTPDRVDDVVEPKGAEFTLPVPFLWQHDKRQPIGNVIEANVSDDGIAVKFKLAHPDEVKSEKLKERLQEAYDSIKNRLGAWAFNWLSWS